MTDSKKKQAISGTGVIGLDIGFGDVKVASSVNGGISVSKFPTAIAAVQASVVEFAAGEKEYLYQGRRFHIGERAVQRAIPTRSFSFLEQYAPLLAYRAVKESDVAPKSLAVGLPLIYFDKEHKELLQNALGRVEVDGESLEFDVHIYPQGVGCLLDYRLADDGSQLQSTRNDGIVIDIGFNTVDVVAFVDGRAQKEDSAMLERQGVSVITQELASVVQKQTRMGLSDQEAKQVLYDAGYTAYGKHVDLTAEIDQIVQNYVEKLIFTVQSRWEDRLQRASRMILAGGGAYYLKNHIPEQYAHLLHLPEAPEFANARGYLKSTLSRMRQQASAV